MLKIFTIIIILLALISSIFGCESKDVGYSVLVGCGGTQSPSLLMGPESVTIEAKAEIGGGGGVIGGRAYSNPIEVVLTFTDGAAAEAYRYGQVQITTARDDKGGDLEIIDISDRLPEFEVINHTAVDFHTNELEHPEDGFSVELRFFPVNGVTEIATLEGTVTLQTVNCDKVIRIENLDSMIGISHIQIDDPLLEAMGDFSMGFNDYVTLSVSGQEVPDDLEVRIIDAQGNIWYRQSYSSSGSGKNKSKEWGFAIPDKDLPGAWLEIVPAYNSLEIPFELLEITIDQ